MSKVNKEEFLSALESCQPGLGHREIIDQETCFVFEGGYVCTFNDETSCRIESGLGEDFLGAVQATPLLDILRKLQEETLDIQEVEGEFLIVGKNKEAALRREAEVKLPVSIIEKPKDWQALDDNFCEAASIVSQCTSRDENQFNITCVHVTPKWIEATDMFNMCRWRIKTNFQEELLLRRGAIKNLGSLGADKFSETESWVHFKNARGLILSCRRYTDVTEYPDIKKYLNIEGQPLTLPKGLAEAADKAQVFTAPEGEDDDEVIIDLKPGRLKIIGKGAQGRYKELKKIKYDGPPLKFLIPPALLIDIVKKHSECSVTEDHLIVKSGSYRYITCLSKDVSSNGVSRQVGKSKREEGEE